MPESEAQLFDQVVGTVQPFLQRQTGQSGPGELVETVKLFSYYSTPDCGKDARALQQSPPTSWPNNAIEYRATTVTIPEGDVAFDVHAEATDKQWTLKIDPSKAETTKVRGIPEQVVPAIEDRTAAAMYVTRLVGGLTGKEPMHAADSGAVSEVIELLGEDPAQSSWLPCDLEVERMLEFRGVAPFEAPDKRVDLGVITKTSFYGAVMGKDWRSGSDTGIIMAATTDKGVLPGGQLGCLTILSATRDEEGLIEVETSISEVWTPEGSDETQKLGLRGRRKYRKEIAALRRVVPTSISGVVEVVNENYLPLVTPLELGEE